MRYWREQDFQNLSEREGLQYCQLNFKCLMSNHATFDTELGHVSTSYVPALIQATVAIKKKIALSLLDTMNKESKNAGIIHSIKLNKTTMSYPLSQLVSFREVKDFLGEKPFEDYRHSMYFSRYLQWKWLERYLQLFPFLQDADIGQFSIECLKTKTKPISVLTNATTQSISNRSKTKAKTKVIVWFLFALGGKPL